MSDSSTATAHPRPKVLLIGPQPTRRGGIAALVAMYLAAWDGKQAPMRFLPTVGDRASYIQAAQYAAAVARCIIWLLSWRPDVVHIHFSWRGSFIRKAPLALLAHLAGARVVMHCHASRFEHFYGRRGRLGRALIKWALNSADLIITVSTPIRVFFEQLNLRAPVIVLPNAILAPAATHRPAGKPPVILTLGRLEQPKGVYDTLQAVPHILAAHPTAQFWLGGDGELTEIKRLCAEAPWGDHIHLLGWVRDAAKDAALRQATLFLLPAYAEGLPMAILEAMSYGLPVIATPVGAVPTVVIDGQTGFLIPVGDPAALAARVNELLADPSLGVRLGQNARQLVLTHYEIAPLLGQVYALYRRLLESAEAKP